MSANTALLICSVSRHGSVQLGRMKNKPEVMISTTAPEKRRFKAQMEGSRRVTRISYEIKPANLNQTRP
jgi:hypothetical protein